MREAILLFGGESILPQLRRALLPLKVLIRPIPEEEYTCTLDALTGGEKGETEPYAGPAFPEPMAVFAGFYGNRMDITLTALRKAGIRIHRKAVLTATNRQWTALALYDELGREHEAMQQHLRAHRPKEEPKEYPHQWFFAKKEAPAITRVLRCFWDYLP